MVEGGSILHADHPRKWVIFARRFTSVDRELPPNPPQHSGQRGQVAKSDADNLWERMETHKTAVLLLSKLADVAFTSHGER